MEISSLSILLLFVDDEPLIQDLMVAVLEEAGFRVESALDGVHAIERIEALRRDLAGLVTDIHLPAGPDGWDIARRARELVPSIPVVYVTGDSGYEWSSRGVPESVILAKPFEPSQVVVAISTLIASAGPRVGGSQADPSAPE